jgi:hypothetical protein
MMATGRGGLNDQTPRAFAVMVAARKEGDPLMDTAD